MRQHAQPNSSTSENLPSFLSDIPISPGLPSHTETSFTFHSYPRSTHLNRDHESFSSLSSINATDPPYHTLEENSRPPTLYLYHYPLRVDKQTFNHPRQIPRYHIFPVNRTSTILLLIVIEK